MLFLSNQNSAGISFAADWVFYCLPKYMFTVINNEEGKGYPTKRIIPFQVCFVRSSRFNPLLTVSRVNKGFMTNSVYFHMKIKGYNNVLHVAINESLVLTAFMQRLR